MPLASDSPSLEQLKRQAKELLRAYRVDHPPARARIAAHLPHLVTLSPARSGGRTVLLAHALLVIARENGFPSWPRLKAAVLAGRAGMHPLADEKSLDLLPGTCDMTHSRAPAAPPLGARRATTIAALGRDLAELTARQDVAGLATRFSRLPRRDILAVRAFLVAGGEQSLLVDVLLAGLTSRNARVRYDCAHALDHFADERCLEPLRQLVNDPVPRVRRMALHVLNCDVCKLTPLPAADDLLTLLIDRALADPSINVRRHATVALGACRTDPRAVQVLHTLATQTPDTAIRREARRALRRKQEPSSA
jgi:hypothetical protein